MRSRSTSPFPTYGHQMVRKYYSRQQVSQILKAMVQSKLNKIYEELEQKQQMIRSLNQKLNRNDTYLQNSSKLILQITDKCQQSSKNHYEETLELINKLLNDKLNSYWHTIQLKLDTIHLQMNDVIKIYHSNLQDKINEILKQIKCKCQEHVEYFKKKNNTYWIKVKDALTKIHTKTTLAQEKIGGIGLQISKYEAEREVNKTTMKQLQNGQNTAKMLLQLKKSVSNVYKNFQDVLKLQQSVRQRYEQSGPQKLICQRCMCPNPQLRIQPQKNITNINWNKNKMSKQDDIVILQYSVQQDTLSNHQVYSNINKQENTYKVVQYDEQKNKKNVMNIGMDEGSPLSPITGKVIENLSNTIQLLGTDKSKHGHLTVNTNYTTKNQTRNWADNDMGVNSHNYFGENINNEHSNSFQFHNSSNQGLGGSVGNSRFMLNPNNQASTSMLNFSLDCRKEMLESVKPRLIEMIQTKGLEKPLRVYLDQINYLKNEEGNYLFDLKGNMFKLSSNDFMELEKEKVLKNVNCKESSRKIKKIN